MGFGGQNLFGVNLERERKGKLESEWDRKGVSDRRGMDLERGEGLRNHKVSVNLGNAFGVGAGSNHGRRRKKKRKNKKK